jgi:hypothetical protein
MNATNILLATLALAEIAKGQPQAVAVVAHHKELVKRTVPAKQPRPGRNRPAKGYDPLTKTWHK